MSNAAPATPDALPDNWVDRFAPAAAKPYLRLMRADRPIGTWLLLLPCWFGLALAAAQGARAPYLWYAALFAIGSIVMRGAGCAYNDIVDRDIDAGVARTAGRPLPSGQISMGGAWAFLVALCLAGLLVLLQFNRTAILIGLSSLLLVAAYPFMKRITWWPQAWLGLTFNWGVLVGHAAAAGAVSPAALALYAGCLLWTVGYDTIYAHQDREDDALIGVKSAALALGGRTRTAILLLYGGGLALFALAGVLSGLGPLYFAALTAPGAHFWRQWRRLEIDNPRLCLELFKSNRNAGFLLLAPFLLEAALSPA